MDEIEQKLAILFRNTRKAKGLDVRGLSVLSGVSIATISYLESGKISASIRIIVKMCNALEITPENLGMELGLGVINFTISKATLLEAGDRIWIARSSKRKTQEDVTRETGICRSSISRIEAGKSERYPFSYLVALERLFPGLDILPTFWAVYSHDA